MAKATLNIFPTEKQLIDFGYSDLAATYAYMAATFNKTKIDCDIAMNADWSNGGEKIEGSLHIWVDGICLPIDWFNVIGLTGEEKQLVAKHNKKSKLVKKVEKIEDSPFMVVRKLAQKLEFYNMGELSVSCTVNGLNIENFRLLHAYCTENLLYTNAHTYTRV